MGGVSGQCGSRRRTNLDVDETLILDYSGEVAGLSCLDRCAGELSDGTGLAKGESRDGK